MEANSEPRNTGSTVRRRRRMGRTVREKTPDPNVRISANGRQRYSDDDSSQLEGATASEGGAQTIRMQIRAPGTMSAHESKILRRRDKAIATAAARSHSQPRQAERLSSPEASQLLHTAKRSLSSPRHNKEESSENENAVAKRRSPPTRASSERQQTLHTAAIADENLNRLEQNLRRFEEERRRFEAEKRQFELEKREHRLRNKQLDADERKRLLANYRKLSDRIQLPQDEDERRRLVRSLRLQHPVANYALTAAAAVLPKERVRNRSLNYDESSTQFSSSDADADDLQVRRQLNKPLAPVRRNNSAASNFSAPTISRGPPPQPPERRVVSRNHSLSPIRPQRRSKTPEQRAELMRKLAEATAGFNGAELAVNVIPPIEEVEIEKKKPQSQKVETPKAKLSDESQSSSRRSSLRTTELRQRKRSLESPAIIKVEEVQYKPILEPTADTTPESIPQLTTQTTFLQKLSSYFRRSKPEQLCATETAIKSDAEVTTDPDSLTFKQLVKAFLNDAREQWHRLKDDYTVELSEMRHYRNKCISHTVMLIMLCGFGGLMFRYTEGTSENIYKCEVRKVKRDFIDHLWTVSHNMREDDWKTLARQKLRKFEEELYALQELGPRRYYPGMKSWNFVNCIIYCWTVLTTIGYGHITPKTILGKSLTIIYAIIGIPLFLILLADFGKLFTRGMKFLWAYVRRLYYTGTCRQIRKQQQVRDAIGGFNAVYDMAVRRPSHFFGMGPDVDDESSRNADETGTVAASHGETPTSPYPETFEVDDEFNLPISVASVLLISYILIGAFVYTLWEDWSYFDAFYFVFISMSTIGFGDFVPNHPIFMMCSIIYLIFGLALTSMFINVVQIKLSDTFKEASAKIGATIGFNLASEVGDDALSQLKTPSELASVHGSRLEKISEDSTDHVVSPQQMPASILRNARPTSPAAQSQFSQNSHAYPEQSTESDQKKKKGFFW